LVAVAEGVGELLVGDRVSSLRAGTVAVVPAGQVRGIRARSRPSLMRATSRSCASVSGAWRRSCAMPLLAHLRPVEFEALTAQPEHTRQ